MKAEELRELQAPLKEKYREDPNAATVTLRATGHISEGVTCKVETGHAIVAAGLHPATGGDGTQLCSGDMLLEALVACAGVTLRSVSTALEIPLRDAKVTAEGDLDFRGALAVAKDAPKKTLDKLVELTERYCVVLQTLQQSPQITVTSKLTVN